MPSQIPHAREPRHRRIPRRARQPGAREVAVAAPEAQHEDGAGNMACVCVFGGEGRGGAYEDDFAGFEDGGGVVERGSSAGDENVGVDDCGGVSLLVGDAVAI
jgi:hypothetical protein